MASIKQQTETLITLNSSSELRSHILFHKRKEKKRNKFIKGQFNACFKLWKKILWWCFKYMHYIPFNVTLSHARYTSWHNCHGLQATVVIYTMFKQFFHLQPVSMESYT